MTALLKGKKGLITGIINDQSIAWAIAEFLKHHGAELLITYRAETLKKRVLPLAEQLNCDFVHELWLLIRMVIDYWLIFEKF